MLRPASSLKSSPLSSSRKEEKSYLERYKHRARPATKPASFKPRTALSRGSLAPEPNAIELLPVES